MRPLRAETLQNPSFRAFDLSIYGPDVTRLDAFIVRVWAKAETMEDYQLLLELSLSLQSLQFMGKSVSLFTMTIYAAYRPASLITFTSLCLQILSSYRLWMECTNPLVIYQCNQPETRRCLR